MERVRPSSLPKRTTTQEIMSTGKNQRIELSYREALIVMHCIDMLDRVRAKAKIALTPNQIRRLSRAYALITPED
jgi:hypothetical protein